MKLFRSRTLLSAGVLMAATAITVVSLNGGSAIVLRLLPSVSTSDECTGAAIPGLTFSRSSSATCTKSDGTVVLLSANQPRVEGKGLLVEGSGTNIALQSESFDNAAWTVASTTITANNTSAPDGNATADKVAVNATGNFKSVSQTFTATAAVYTGSVYLKGSGSITTAAIGLFNVGGAAFVASTAAVVNGSCSVSMSSNRAIITSLSTSAWCRVAVTSSSALTAASYAFYVYPGDPATQAIGDAVFAWGAQAEASAFATSYIPTAGTSATRSVDLARLTTNPAAFNLNEGCSKMCLAPGWTGNAPASAFLFDGDATSQVTRFLFINSGANAVNSTMGSSATTSLAANFTAGQKRCYVTRWTKAGNSLAVYNTTDNLSVSSTYASTPPTLNTIAFGSNSNGGLPIASGSISDIQLGRSSGACN